MSRTLILFLAVAAVGNALYHLAQKTVPGSANPMLALMGAYAVAFAASAAAAPFFSAGRGAPGWGAQMFSGPVLLLGVAAFLIEVGFLLAYRKGGGLQWSGVAVNAAAALMLIPVALAVFKEPFSLARIAGMGLCLAGLALIAR